jgi:glycosyltransferase involved in cell wall biosynthesis
MNVNVSPDPRSCLRTSIIVSSYNYARYLRQAIDSALAQTAAEVEVIVVDDGSTDDSAQIIRSYGDRIRAVFKPNGGQASAWNAGFASSRGQIVLFLDSDDVLDAAAVEQVQQRFAEGGLAKVHWPLRVIDELGRSDGRRVPPGDLPVGDLRDQVLRSGVVGYAWPPTSGNAWSRRFLEQVMPIRCSPRCSENSTPWPSRWAPGACTAATAPGAPRWISASMP